MPAPRARPGPSRGRSARGTASPPGTCGRARAGPAPAGDESDDSIRRAARPRRVLGTKPPMAFISVDLPAPLVPISPTISPAPTSIDTSSTARMPPKLHGDVAGPQDRHAVGQRAPAPGGASDVGDVALLLGRRVARARSPIQSNERVAGRVADLHEPAGEVEQQDEQADARREQRHERRCRGRTRAGRSPRARRGSGRRPSRGRR